MGGLAASGWHTCAVVGEALQAAMAKVPDYLGIAAIDELRWMQPVRPDDELFGAVTLGPPATCTCGSSFDRRPAWVEVRNGCGKSVLRWTCQMLFGARRPWMPVAQCAFTSVRPSKVVGRPGEHLVKFFEDVLRGDEIALGSYTFCPESVGSFETIIVAQGEEVATGTSRSGPDRVKAWNVVAGWMSLITSGARQSSTAPDAPCQGSGLPPASGGCAGWRRSRWASGSAFEAGWSTRCMRPVRADGDCWWLEPRATTTRASWSFHSTRSFCWSGGQPERKAYRQLPPAQTDGRSGKASWLRVAPGIAHAIDLHQPVHAVDWPDRPSECRQRRLGVGRDRHALDLDE